MRMRLSQSPAQNSSAHETVEQEQNAANEMIDRFISVYGSTVKAEDIPKEVWEKRRRLRTSSEPTEALKTGTQGRVEETQDRP